MGSHCNKLAQAPVSELKGIVDSGKIQKKGGYNMRSTLLSILVACMVCLVCVPSSSSETVADQLQSYCDGQYDSSIAGGYAISVIEDDEVVFRKAYGMANNEYDLPLTTQSVFDFASIAKTFTGWAVARLIIDGTISLEDDIHTYVTELPDFGHKITIAHLLYHTSGLPDWYELIGLAGKPYTDVYSKEMLLELIFSQKELLFAPGERFEYSNSGYLLLAEMVERVSGQNFADWCEENIFAPLEMKNTRFLKNHAEIINGRAMAYRGNGDTGYVNCFSQLHSPGSSSLYSTLDDMTLWLKEISRREFGGSEGWELMLRKGTLSNGDSVNYGCGISMRYHDSHTSIGHGGSWLGYLSDLVYYPEEKVGYVLMITRNPPAVSFTGKVDEILLGNSRATR